MTRIDRIKALVVLLAVVGLTTSCATWRDDSTPTRGADYREENVDSGPQDRSAYEARLRRLVREGIEEAESASDSQRSELIYKRPYFFREYEVYPGEDMDIEMRETDEKTAPLKADVTLDKQRFSTRLHRRKDEAETDFNWLRDTGTETITYELRNGRWTRLGSLFVAEKTEEQINGEWVPLEEEVRRTIAAEEVEADSWWRRAWQRMTGR